MLCSLTLDLSVPPVFLPLILPLFLPLYLSVCLPLCLPLCPPLCLPLCLPLCPPWSLFFLSSVSLSLYVSPLLSVWSLSLFIPLCNVKLSICFSGERYSFPHIELFLLKKKPSWAHVEWFLLKNALVGPMLNYLCRKSPIFQKCASFCWNFQHVESRWTSGWKMKNDYSTYSTFLQ